MTSVNQEGLQVPEFIPTEYVIFRYPTVPNLPRLDLERLTYNILDQRDVFYAKWKKERAKAKAYKKLLRQLKGTIHQHDDVPFSK